MNPFPSSFVILQVQLRCYQWSNLDGIHILDAGPTTTNGVNTATVGVGFDTLGTSMTGEWSFSIPDVSIIAMGSPDGGLVLWQFDYVKDSNAQNYSFTLEPGVTIRTPQGRRLFYMRSVLPTVRKLSFHYLDRPIEYHEVIGPRLYNAVTFKYLRATAQPSSSNILVEWETANEMDHGYFTLWRSTSSDNGFELVDYFPAEGDSVSGAKYEYVDNDISSGTEYYYKLEELDNNGVSTWHGPVSAIAPPGSNQDPTPSPTPIPPTPTPIPPTPTPYPIKTSTPIPPTPTPMLFPTPTIIPPTPIPPSGPVILEAESGSLSGMSNMSNPPGCTYIYGGDWQSGSTNFTFNVSQAGNYKIFGNVANPTGAGAFYYQLDNGPITYWYFSSGNSAWHWNRISTRYDLSPGTHSLRIYGGRSSTKLDVLEITPNWSPSYTATCSG